MNDTSMRAALSGAGNPAGEISLEDDTLEDLARGLDSFITASEGASCPPICG